MFVQRGREQQRWAYLFSTELISKQEAEAWAEQVWPSERGEEESEEEPAETEGAKAPKITFKDYDPSDPVYSEGPQRLEQRERLVAEIKKHHPKATTEQILRDLEAWGEIETNPDHHEAEIAKHHNDWTGDTDGEAYLQRLVEARGGDPTADLRSAGRQLEAGLQAAIAAAQR